jgi:hypothetical protein
MMPSRTKGHWVRRGAVAYYPTDTPDRPPGIDAIVMRNEPRGRGIRGHAGRCCSCRHSIRQAGPWVQPPVRAGGPGDAYQYT